jgi:hypothetical protein
MGGLKSFLAMKSVDSSLAAAPKALNLENLLLKIKEL